MCVYACMCLRVCVFLHRVMQIARATVDSVHKSPQVVSAHMRARVAPPPFDRNPHAAAAAATEAHRVRQRS